MDYKDEMRKMIDIVKQQSFNAPLEQCVDDLAILSHAIKDLSDRINIRLDKSLYTSDKEKLKGKKKQSKTSSVKRFPSVKQMPIPKPISNANSSATSNAVSSTAISANDINNMRNDFVAKQQAVQPIKPQSTI